LLAQVRYVVCSDATPVASTYEGFRTDGSACPSTLLAQVRYVVADVAIESFLDMESDGLKAELQQCPARPKGWRDAVLGVRQTVPSPLGCSK
jgi:hypothetical protein